MCLSMCYALLLGVCECVSAGAANDNHWMRRVLLEVGEIMHHGDAAVHVSLNGLDFSVHAVPFTYFQMTDINPVRVCVWQLPRHAAISELACIVGCGGW